MNKPKPKVSLGPDRKPKSVVLEEEQFKICFYLENGKMKQAWKDRADGDPVLSRDDQWIYPVLYKSLRKRARRILFPKKKS